MAASKISLPPVRGAPERGPEAPLVLWLALTVALTLEKTLA
jgi:hypothetical protein